MMLLEIVVSFSDLNRSEHRRIIHFAFNETAIGDDAVFHTSLMYSVSAAHPSLSYKWAYLS